MTALAARKAWRMTKSVRSVWFSATARNSSAFSSGRIRKDIRLLSSTATLGMALSPLCTYSISTYKDVYVNLMYALVVLRTGCERVPLGVVEARFTRRLLWPTQHLHTAPFVPSTQLLRTGDKVRFVVFADDQKLVELISAAFVVD